MKPFIIGYVITTIVFMAAIIGVIWALVLLISMIVGN